MNFQTASTIYFSNYFLFLKMNIHLWKWNVETFFVEGFVNIFS